MMDKEEIAWMIRMYVHPVLKWVGVAVMMILTAMLLLIVAIPIITTMFALAESWMYFWGCEVYSFGVCRIP